MTSKRGMSLNVAKSLGFVKSKPAEIEYDTSTLPCAPSTLVFHKDGLSHKDIFLQHREAIHLEYRL